jgi:RNA polymerase sigma-32 factor
MVRLAGLEPATYGLEVRCSIQLSYRRIEFDRSIAYVTEIVHINRPFGDYPRGAANACLESDIKFFSGRSGIDFISIVVERSLKNIQEPMTTKKIIRPKAKDTESNRTVHSPAAKTKKASRKKAMTASSKKKTSTKATGPTKTPVVKTKVKAKKHSSKKKALKPEVVASPPVAKDSKKKTSTSDKALVKFDPLQRYLSEISNYKLLTRDEERALGIRVQEHGDKEAAYALVTSNLRLVVKIALEFQRVWMQNLLDLIQEGNIGLMQAVRKFDPYKNVKFSYYASFWIKAYILKFIMDNWRLVKIGTTQGQRKLFFKLKKEKQKLIEQGFDPKPKLLSERLGVSEREIVDMDQRLDGWDVSLDAPLKDDSDTERIEFLSTEAVSAEDQVAKKEIEVLLHNKIDEFRKNMTDREKEIFDLRIFSDTPVTLQEIGDRYGISRERVRQVEKNIIKKMREFFKQEIPDFSSYTEGRAKA